MSLLDAVAELERSLIGERVRAGLRNAKAKGKLGTAKSSRGHMQHCPTPRLRSKLEGDWSRVGTVRRDSQKARPERQKKTFAVVFGQRFV